MTTDDNNLRPVEELGSGLILGNNLDVLSKVHNHPQSIGVFLRGYPVLKLRSSKNCFLNIHRVINNACYFVAASESH